MSIYKRQTPTLEMLLLEMAGTVASLKAIHDELAECGVDNLKPLEVALTLLALAYEKIEVENVDGDLQKDRGLS